MQRSVTYTNRGYGGGSSQSGGRLDVVMNLFDIGHTSYGP